MIDVLNGPTEMRRLPMAVGAESEKGYREENQDHMTGFPSDVGTVYVIADGMGGHRGGAAASRIVTERLRDHLSGAGAEATVPDAVNQAVQLTNRELFEKSNSGDVLLGGMGSTLCLVVITERQSEVELLTAHVGDSRIYLQREGRLSLLTKDHTLVQRLLDSHAIDEEAARHHPDASILTRAMGQTPDVALDISQPIPLRDGDGILLCSDGLSGYVPHAALEEAIKRNPNPADCAKALVQLALDTGSDDNITVQFVRLGTSPSPMVPHIERPARKTEPESEVLRPVANRQPSAKYAVLKRRQWMPWAVVGALVLCISGGGLAFRSSVFRSSRDNAYRSEGLVQRTTNLRETIGRDLIALASEISKLDIQLKASPHDAHLLALRRECLVLKDRMDKSYAETNRLEADARNASLPMSLNGQKKGPKTSELDVNQRFAALTGVVKKEEQDLNDFQKSGTPKLRSAASAEAVGSK